MRNINNLGGGAKSSLKNKKTTSVFKPLIASSLALALGASVAVATDPTFQFGTEGINADNTIKSPSNIAVDGVTWATDGTLLKPTGIDTINIVFEKSEATASSSVSGSALTITAGGQIQATRQPTIQIASSKGLKFGKLSVDFDSAEYATDNNNTAKANSRTAILDLSSVASGVAFQGDIEVKMGSAKDDPGYANENHFIGKFGGSGMVGNIVIKRTDISDGDGFRGDFIFSNDANLTGNVTLEANDNTAQKQTFTFGNGDIIGTLTSNSNGTTTIIYNKENKEINQTTLVLNAGLLEYQFANGVTSKIFTFDSSKATINGGGLSFRGANKVVLDGDLAVGGNGYVAFYMDSSAQATSTSPIVEGNIVANNGSVIFALNDLTSVNGVNPFDGTSTTQPSNTYYVDGNITITNGGLSAFWDDSEGFYGKIALKSGQPINQTGGLVGKNDAWFATAITNLPSIQATLKTSHLVFDEKQTISGAKVTFDGSEKTIGILANGGSSQILFKQGATITGDIFASSGKTNTITFKQDTKIDGNITSIYNNSQNIITADGNLTVNQILGSKRGSTGGGDDSQNTITFNGNELIVKKGIWAFGNYDSSHQNIINLTQDDATLTINDGGITSLDCDGLGVTKAQLNKITFTNGGTLTLKGSGTTVSHTALDFDGILSTSDDSNTIIFNGDNNATIDVSQNRIQANGAKNTITFNGSGVNTLRGAIVANGGTNEITGVTSITGDVTQNSGSNIITLKGTNSILTGNVSAGLNTIWGNGKNDITFTNGGTLKGNISIVADATTSLGNGSTVINFNSNTNAKIEGDMAIQDGMGGNKGLEINFKGSGVNQIVGNINSTSDSSYIARGRVAISFADSTNQASITGNLRAVGGSIEITTASSLVIDGTITTNSDLTYLLGSGSTAITANDDSTITFKGNINSNDSTTAITASSGTIALGTSSKGINIHANGGGSGFNKIEAKTINTYISSLSTSGNSSNTNKNTITATSGTMNIDSISASGSGNTDSSKQVGNFISLASGTLTIGSMSSSNNTKNDISFGGTGTINGNITTSGAGQNNLTLTADSATLTLNGKTSGGTNHNITSLTAKSGGTNTLTLDNSSATSGAISTTIHSITNGNDLAVVLKGKGAGKGATLILDNATGTTLKSVAVGSGATTDNFLEFGAGTNSILGNISIGSDQDLNINLSGATTSLSLTNGFSNDSGSAYINVKDGADATLSGGALDTTKLTFAGTSALTINNNSASLGEISVNTADATLKGKTASATTLSFAGESSFTLDNEGLTLTNISVNTADATLKGDALTATTLSFAGTSSFTLDNSGLTLTNISVDTADATLKGDAISVTTLSFAGTSSLNIANAGATIAGISITSGNATLEGLAINNSNLTFTADNTALTLNNAGANFGTVDSTSASGVKGAKLTVNSGISASINQNKGNNLKVVLNGQGEESGATLKIKGVDTGSTLTLASISMGSNSTNNTLDLTELADTVTNVTFTNGIAVGKIKGSNGAQENSREGLSIRVKGLSSAGGRTLDFGSGLTTENGTSTLAILDGNATLTGSAKIDLTSLDISGNGDSTVTFESETEIGTLTAQADGKDNLIVGKILTIGKTDSTLDQVTLTGTTAGLTIKGGTQTISALETNATTANNLTFSNNTLTLGTITGSNPINLNLNDSTLALKGDTYAVSSLTANNTLIDMAMTDNNGRPRATRNAKKLEIGANSGDGFKGNASFEVYVNGSTADSIAFTKAQAQDNGEKSVATIIASGDINTILNGNNKLTIATNGSTDSLEIVGGERLIGGVIVETVLNDENKDGTVWTLGKGVDRGAPIQYQEVASTALTVNYDLFLANFNSLNKRMGELRDNPYAQGVWTRVFGGAMSNDFGAGSKTEYVTAQAGYDYSLTLGDARNYMGIAVAYGKSWTKSNSLSMNGLLGSSGSISLQDVNSNMVEVGIYNSYVADSGWYNDTIFKFDYIMSEFSLSNDVNTMTDTSNFAMVLSDEFGYRYKFAESAKGNWYIDPQVEVAFGYFNQSDFNRAMYDTTGIYQSTMEATQDTILTLRTRAGMSLGKKFISSKGFATLYVGAFYEYDYIDGGNIGVAGRVGGTHTSLDSIESNGRAIVNIGSNIELTDGVRMYIDVEKSFGDKQRTDMQFNFGARYSFGDKTPSTSYLADEKKRSTAPLKVEEKPQVQESKAEAPQTNTEVKQ